MTAFFVKLQSIITSPREIKEQTEEQEENEKSEDKTSKNNRFTTKKKPALLTRIQGIQLARFLGPLFVLYIGLPQIYTSHIFGALGPTLVAYILRQPTMNCVTALSRSLIMDVVPLFQRARWNAAESLLGASWSGSALLGGYLSDKYGYRSTFLITTAFHFTAFLIVTMASRTKEMRGTDNEDEGDGDKKEHEEEQKDDNDDEISSRYFRPTSVEQRVSGINNVDEGDDDENENDERRALLR